MQKPFNVNVPSYFWDLRVEDFGSWIEGTSVAVVLVVGVGADALAASGAKEPAELEGLVLLLNLGNVLERLEILVVGTSESNFPNS